MDDELRRYSITAYTERETLDVEASCPDDERAVDKARRYASLKYFKGLPAVIFGHVVCEESDGPRIVGTWEYRLKGVRKSYVRWHSGEWDERPTPNDRAALREWGTRAE